MTLAFATMATISLLLMPHSGVFVQAHRRVDVERVMKAAAMMQSSEGSSTTTTTMHAATMMDQKVEDRSSADDAHANNNNDQDANPRRRLDDQDDYNSDSFLVKSLPLLEDGAFQTKHWAGKSSD
jgi:hypothetical protein